jgi:hypothetical protein
VNVRLDEDLVRILEAAAFVESSSLSELVRGPVEAAARRWSAVPAVRTALKAREQHGAGLDAEVLDVEGPETGQVP